MNGTVYVAGPMTGKPRYNLDAFIAVKTMLTERGYTPVIPHDVTDTVWTRHYGAAFNYDADTCEYGNPLLREMFLANLAELLASDFIYLLDGFQQSRGAMVELQLAVLFNIPVLTVQS